MSDASDLKTLRREWDAWAAAAERSEEGWPSDFPRWDELMAAAFSKMTQPEVDEESLEDVTVCWVLSEENESLQDRVRAEIGRCWSWIARLASSEQASCRWQIYALCGEAPSGEPILRAGLNDEDAYARRRAILALARHKPADAASIARPLVSDPDPYIRQASIDLIEASNDEALRDHALQLLRADPVEHVRVAAEARLRPTRPANK